MRREKSEENMFEQYLVVQDAWQQGFLGLNRISQGWKGKDEELAML